MERIKKVNKLIPKYHSGNPSGKKTHLLNRIDIVSNIVHKMFLEENTPFLKVYK
jgi:hypothetical protein